MESVVTECAEILKTTRKSVTLYLDSNKIFNNKWIFSSIELSKEQLSKFLIPLTVWEVVTGELLGDGYLSCDPIRKPLINARLEFTFAAKILHYVNYLKFNVLAPLCTSSKPTPWSNSKLEGKEPTQYWFSTKRLPVLTSLHGVWYKEIEGKFIKVLPYNIEEFLTPIALASVTHTTLYIYWPVMRWLKIYSDRDDIVIVISIIEVGSICKRLIMTGDCLSYPFLQLVWDKGWILMWLDLLLFFFSAYSNR